MTTKTTKTTTPTIRARTPTTSSGRRLGADAADAADAAPPQHVDCAIDHALTWSIAQSTSAGVRVDAWIEAGLEVSPSYDPLLAKVIAAAGDREQALDGLGAALQDVRVDGVTTNLGLLRAALALPDFRSAEHSTSTLNGVTDPEPRIEVLVPGALTTVQDWPGRLGYWQVGVPPSGRHVWWIGMPIFTFEGAKVRDLYVLGDIHGLIGRLKG